MLIKNLKTVVNIIFCFLQQNILNCSASLSRTVHFEFPVIPTSHGLASSSWPLGEQRYDVGYLQENLVRLLTSRRGIYQADRPCSSGVYGTFFIVLQPLIISINTETLSNRHDVQHVCDKGTDMSAGLHHYVEI